MFVRTKLENSIRQMQFWSHNKLLFVLLVVMQLQWLLIKTTLLKFITIEVSQAVGNKWLVSSSCSLVSVLSFLDCKKQNQNDCYASEEFRCDQSPEIDKLVIESQ